MSRQATDSPDDEQASGGAPPLLSKRNTSAPIWTYFGFKPDGSGRKIANEHEPVCRECRKTVKVKQGNTSNLYSHMRTTHPRIYKDLNAARSKVSTSRTTSSASDRSAPSQGTITEAFARHTPYSRHSQTWNKYTSAVTYFLAKDLQPFRTVERKGFVHLLKELDPRYELPSRKYFSETAIPKMYNQVKEDLLNELEKVEFFSSTSDMWSGEKLTPFMSYTVHWIDDDWRLQSRSLQTLYLPENHTADVIADAMTNTLESWGLVPKAQVCITTDNGANIVAASNQLKWTRLSCFGHNLHLAINNAMKTDRRIDRAIGVCKNIVGAFSHSFARRRDLHREQENLNLPHHALITESATRWGSRQMMVHRMLEQQVAIKRVLSANRQTASLAPTWQDLDVLTALDNVLTPLADFTDIMSGEKYVTVSAIIPLLFHLSTEILCDQEDDTPLATDMKKRIHEYLENKYSDENTAKFLHVATVLDPRFKASFSEKLIDNSREFIVLEATAAYEYDREHNACSDDEEQQPPPHKRRTLGSLFKSKPSTSPSQSASTIEERVQRELDLYLSADVIDSDQDPLQWWRDFGKVNYPTIARIVRKYLCTCATSAASERLFSTAGDIYTPLRSSLTPEKVNMLVFLAKNLPNK